MAVPPTRIGVYEITGQLGEGGMGQVYRATDTTLGRQVAIKILPEAFASDPDRLARFEREARTLASLNHPHIAAVHGFERSSGINALVMELVEGEDLSHIIARGPLPIDEALAIASQIAEALEAAHEQGIIHRDLKPANIKVREDGTVKVLDFGLAKAIAPNDAGAAADEAANSPTLSVRATQAGMILGTAAYMSPEQARGRVTDKRTDLWAFGCVLFEMLSGKRAFDGEDSTEIIAAVVKSTPDWSVLPATVPPRIVTLIKHCLEKDRKLRTGDIAVARFVIGEGNQSVVGAAAAAATPSRFRSIAASVALLFGVALAMLGWIHFREQSPAEKTVRFEISAPSVMSPTGQAVVSPDGKHIAIQARGPTGVVQLWLQSLDSLEAKPVPGTENAQDAVWSPDSQFIAFAALNRLRKVSIAGGGAQTICDLPAPYRGGAWSPSGEILFGTLTKGLMRVPEAGGTPTAVTVINPDAVLQHSPWFLPDGRHFLYTAEKPGATSGSDLGIYVGSLDATPEQQPTDPVEPGAYGAMFAPSVTSKKGWLVFIQDGFLRARPFDPQSFKAGGDTVSIDEGFSLTSTQRLFSISLDGVLTYRSGARSADQRLTWFDREGKNLGTVGDPGTFNTVSLSPDGTKVVVSRVPQSASIQNADLWVYEFARGTSTRFTFDPANELAGIWSRDGKDITFSLDRSGNYELFRKPSNGTGKDIPLLTGLKNKYPQDWSPDGRVLIYSVSPQGGGALDLAILNAADGKTQDYVKTDFVESQGQFSPDGRFVAYTSNASGRYEILVQPFPNPDSGKWMVSRDGGVQPRWRSDGHELFFISADSKLMSAEVSTTGGFSVGAAKALFPAPISGGGQINNVFRYAVTPDGKRSLINTETSAAKSTISIVLGWEGLLVSKR